LRFTRNTLIPKLMIRIKRRHKCEYPCKRKKCTTSRHWFPIVVK